MSVTWTEGTYWHGVNIYRQQEQQQQQQLHYYYPITMNYNSEVISYSLH